MATRKDRSQDRRIQQLQQQMVKRPRYANPGAGRMGSYGGSVGYGSTRHQSMTEIKGVDTMWEAYQCIQAPAVKVLNLTAPGSGSFNRIGRKFNMKSIRMMGNFYPAQSNTTKNTPTFARLVVVYDKQSNGTALVPNTTLFAAQKQDGTKDQSVTYQHFLPIDLDQRERFEVIIDKIFVINNALTTTGILSTDTAAYNAPGSGNGMFVDEFRKLKRREVQYKSDTVTAAVTDIQTGALHAFICSDDATAKILFEGVVRLRYYDM